MIQGFNHNVIHKGKLFHIQTEDNGIKHPYIRTHIFVDGNIIGTLKISYEDIVYISDLQNILQEMMQSQHTNMLRDLKSGKYDKFLEEEKAEKESFNQTFDELALDFLNKKDT